MGNREKEYPEHSFFSFWGRLSAIRGSWNSLIPLASGAGASLSVQQKLSLLIIKRLGKICGDSIQEVRKAAEAKFHYSSYCIPRGHNGPEFRKLTWSICLCQQNLKLWQIMWDTRQRTWFERKDGLEKVQSLSIKVASWAPVSSWM